MTDEDIVRDFLENNGLAVVNKEILKQAYDRFGFEFWTKDHGDFVEWGIKECPKDAIEGEIIDEKA